MPNDEEEQTRLQMVHEVYFNVLGKRHTTISLKDPKKILDIGTGTGEWAMAMADDYPDAEVIGTDIARIQPGAVPPNVFFEIDDAEEDGGWTWPDDEFDMIHIRYMQGAFKDWKHIYRETFNKLKPGGIIEVLDFDDHQNLKDIYTANDTTAAPRLLDLVGEAMRKLGRPRSVDHLEPNSLTELGFVDVECKEFQIPMGAWPENPEAQKTGKHFLMSIIVGVEALCLRPLTEQLGWKHEDILEVCEQVRETTWSIALDPTSARGMGFTFKVLTGRKPEGEEEGDWDSSRTMSMSEVLPSVEVCAAA